MHDTELTNPDGAHRRRPRRRKAFDVAPFRKLFRMFGWLRAASPDALDEFFFKRRFPGQSRRTSHRMVAALVAEGYLAKVLLPNARVLYHLTRSSLATFEQSGLYVPETLRRAPTPEVGGYLWLLSSLRAELARQGFTVGRGPREAWALRRFLLDGGTVDRAASAIRADAAFSPPMTSGCESCGFEGSLFCSTCRRPTSVVPRAAQLKCVRCRATRFAPGVHDGPEGTCHSLVHDVESVAVDVAWRKVNGRYDVRLLFVEHPSRGLGAQLAELPVKHLGPPRVAIILRSTDPDSRFDKRASAWVVKGTRHQQLERAFSDAGWPGFFAFAKTTRVIDVRRDLQLHTMRSGAPAPAWECGAPWGGRGKLGPRERDEREREAMPRDAELARSLDFAELRARARDEEARARDEFAARGVQGVEREPAVARMVEPEDERVAVRRR